MKTTDLRAKARAIFGPAIAEPMPKQPNGAKALQERANARPIPTYKVGGSVKKNTPPQPTAAEREADRKRREEYAKMKVTKEQGAAITRGNRAADIEGGRYKDGGKVAKYKEGDIVVSANKPKSDSGMNMQNLNYRLPQMDGGRGGGGGGGSRGLQLSPTVIRQPSSDLSRISGTAPPRGVGLKGTVRFKKGGDVQTSADTAKKLATEMGGMKKGGKPKKDGLAVMIAIGSPMKGMKNMKRPVKKAAGGRTEGRDMKGTPIAPTAGQTSAAMQRMMGNQALVAPKNATIQEKIAVAKSMPSTTGKARFVVNYDDTPVERGTAKTSVAEIKAEAERQRRNAPEPVTSPGFKKGGAIMKPVKRAQGGAGKVRKGMMTPEGKIIAAMNKVRGK